MRDGVPEASRYISGGMWVQDADFVVRIEAAAGRVYRVASLRLLAAKGQKHNVFPFVIVALQRSNPGAINHV